MENYNEEYLMHYGIKGMKWGVRRYQNADGSLTDKGIKKYAKKGYSQDSYNSNKSKLGKAYDKVTGAHKYAGDMMYDMSSKKANKARAEKYLADKQSKKSEPISQVGKAVGKAVVKSVEKTRERNEKRRKSYETTTKYLGVGGAALRSYSEFQTKKFVKGTLAKAVNASENSYINNSNNYRVSRGVDFARNTVVKGLSLSSNIDQIQAYANVARSAMYVANRR